MARSIPLTADNKTAQNWWGAQDRLIITAVPAAAAASLIGKTLVDAGQLTVAGTYEVIIPTSGLSVIEVHLQATFATGTVSSGLFSLYYVSNAATPSTWTNKQTGTGTGSLSTTVRQSSTIAALKGEQYCRLTLTLGGTTACTFTQAEYNGL
jgi:hypothetical protein